MISKMESTPLQPVPRWLYAASQEYLILYINKQQWFRTHSRCILTHVMISKMESTPLQPLYIKYHPNLQLLLLPHPGLHHQRLCRVHCHQVPEIPRKFKTKAISHMVISSAFNIVSSCPHFIYCAYPFNCPSSTCHQLLSNCCWTRESDLSYLNTLNTTRTLNVTSFLYPII